MAYEARKEYPGQNLWITNEIIHNPTVNEQLLKMGVQARPQDLTNMNMNLNLKLQT
jgi:4-hydroxy-3-methylbut-2-enyl diphosphate reductase